MSTPYPSDLKTIMNQLENKKLSLDNWNDLILHLSYKDMNTAVKYLINRLDKGESYYFDYIKQLLLYDQDENRLTEAFEQILLNTTKITLESQWFYSLWKTFFNSNTSEILIRNFFIFAGQLHQRYQFTTNSKFIQSLDEIPSDFFRFELINFQLQYQIGKFENSDILQHFFSASMDIKIDLLGIFSNYQEKERKTLFREILFSPKIHEDQYVLVAFLIEIKKDMNSLFDDYDQFYTFIKEIKDEKALELLFTEWTKPESLEYGWIQEVVLEFIRQNTLLSVNIIEISGEFIAEWDKKFQKAFLQTIMATNIKLKTVLAKIISPLWYDEQIILQLLENDDKVLLEALYESVITIYSLLSVKLQEKILKLFSSSPDNQKFYGLLQAYNIAVVSFKNEVTKSLVDMSDTTKEQLYAGMLVGLGMRWNDLEKPIQAAIIKIEKNLSKTLKRELLQGLDMVYGSLNVEGLNLAVELQSNDYQISMDEIKHD